MEGVRRFLDTRRRLYRVCIAGCEGAGKTTLRQQLKRVLEEEKAEVRVLHRYGLIDNLTAVPLHMIRSRSSARIVEIYDRSIYDNLAVWAARTGLPRWAVRQIARCVRLVYPRFDSSIYLEVDLETTRLRRPGTEPRRFLRLREAYRRVTAAAQFVPVRGDDESLRTVVTLITGGRVSTVEDASEAQ
jgi:thymidylate kinase